MSEEFKKMVHNMPDHLRTNRDWDLWHEMIHAGAELCKYERNGGIIGHMFRTFIAILAIYVIWGLLEVYVYGNVQSRAVDTIIMVLIIPFIFKAVR